MCERVYDPSKSIEAWLVLKASPKPWAGGSWVGAFQSETKLHGPPTFEIPDSLHVQPGGINTLSEFPYAATLESTDTMSRFMVESQPAPFMVEPRFDEGKARRRERSRRRAAVAMASIGWEGREFIGEI